MEEELWKLCVQGWELSMQLPGTNNRAEAALVIRYGIGETFNTGIG